MSPQTVSPSDKQRLANDSLNGPDAALYHPNMKIRFIWGEDDTGVPVGNGPLYFDALTGDVTQTCAPATGHATAAYVGGANVLIEDLCVDCGGSPTACAAPLQ